MQADASTLLNTCLIVIFLVIFDGDLNHVLEHQPDQVEAATTDVALGGLLLFLSVDLFLSESSPELDPLKADLSLVVISCLVSCLRDFGEIEL